MTVRRFDQWRRRLSAALGLLSLCGAQAAPMLHEAAASAATDGERAGAAALQAALPADRPEDQKTLDMLIQLQPTGAGIQFHEPARPRSPIRAAAAPPAGPVGPATEQPRNGASNQVGLFGSGATPPVVQRRNAATVDAEWTARLSGTGAAARVGGFDPNSGSIRSADVEAVAAWLSLPNEVVAYVRDNRKLVLAVAAAALGLLWSGSVAIARARR